MWGGGGNQLVRLRLLSDRDSFLQAVIVRYAHPGDHLVEDRDGLLAAVRGERTTL
jgi:hypothetical protein